LYVGTEVGETVGSDDGELVPVVGLDPPEDALLGTAVGAAVGEAVG